MENKNLETMDRLSDLPKHILDNILSRLPEEDVARTSILSKVWNDTLSTSPILRFSQDNYVYGVRKDLNKVMPMADLERKRNNFADHVEKTLTRFHDQRLAVREFKLHMNCSGSQSMHCRIDHWMRLVVEGGVQVLDLRLLHDEEPLHKLAIDHCWFPPSILEAKSLIKLTLSHGKIDHLLVNNPIKFSSLRKLSLSHLIMRDEQMIQKIISSCTLIEYLSLVSCDLEGQDHNGLKFIKIHGLRKLKTFVAYQIEEIDIDAPSLEFLDYASFKSTIHFKINVTKCKNLKTLRLSSLRSIIITDQWFLELFQKFPLLESLRLDSCNFSEKIKVSSAHLKVLQLGNHCPSFNLKEVKVDAPNLCSLKYRTSMEIPAFSFLSSSNLLQIELIIYFISYWDWKKIRQFLQSFEHRSILASLSIQINVYTEFNIDELRDVPVPPPSIKHLNLLIAPNLHTTAVLDLVIGLLCSCCPTTIYVKRNSKISESVIETLCNVLNSEKHECCCSSRDIKCWWHALKDVQIIKMFGKVYDEITIHLEY